MQALCTKASGRGATRRSHPSGQGTASGDASATALEARAAPAAAPAAEDEEDNLVERYETMMAALVEASRREASLRAAAAILGHAVQSAADRLISRAFRYWSARVSEAAVNAELIFERRVLVDSFMRTRQKAEHSRAETLAAARALALRACACSGRLEARRALRLWAAATLRETVAYFSQAAARQMHAARANSLAFGATAVLTLAASYRQLAALGAWREAVLLLRGERSHRRHVVTAREAVLSELRLRALASVACASDARATRLARAFAAWHGALVDVADAATHARLARLASCFASADAAGARMADMRVGRALARWRFGALALGSQQLAAEKLAVRHHARVAVAARARNVDLERRLQRYDTAAVAGDGTAGVGAARAGARGGEEGGGAGVADARARRGEGGGGSPGSSVRNGVGRGAVLGGAAAEATERLNEPRGGGRAAAAAPSARRLADGHGVSAGAAASADGAGPGESASPVAAAGDTGSAAETTKARGTPGRPVLARWPPPAMQMDLAAGESDLAARVASAESAMLRAISTASSPGPSPTGTQRSLPEGAPVSPRPATVGVARPASTSPRFKLRAADVTPRGANARNGVRRDELPSAHAVRGAVGEEVGVHTAKLEARLDQLHVMLARALRERDEALGSRQLPAEVASDSVQRVSLSGPNGADVVSAESTVSESGEVAESGQAGVASVGLT